MRSGASFTFVIVKTFVLKTAKLLLPAVVLGATLSACDNAEPEVPTVAVPVAEQGQVIKFPVNADGTVDETLLGEITFDDPVYRFGTVDAGALITKRFSFTNTGAAPLVIAHANSSCGCTIPSYPETPVPPGDTASVLVVFNTAGKAGRQDKAVTFTANTFPNTTTIRVVGTVDTFE